MRNTDNHSACLHSSSRCNIQFFKVLGIGQQNHYHIRVSGSFDRFPVKGDQLLSGNNRIALFDFCRKAFAAHIDRINAYMDQHFHPLRAGDTNRMMGVRHRADGPAERSYNTALSRIDADAFTQHAGCKGFIGDLGHSHDFAADRCADNSGLRHDRYCDRFCGLGFLKTEAQHKGNKCKNYESSREPISTVFPLGGENAAYAQYFVGTSYLNMLSTQGVAIGNVTFEPGCRNNWHIHKAAKGGGQILLVTGGRGWYQEWGKPAQELHVGDVVNIPAGVKHWHGAAKDSWFVHLAVEVPGEETSNEWLEPVNNDEYDKLA